MIFGKPAMSVREKACVFPCSNLSIYKERDGWYSSQVFERIKTILRHKFFSLLEGHSATEEECAALFGSNHSPSKVPTTRNQKLRPGKHNLAKGALRPEDAAVFHFIHYTSLILICLQAARLRATLERNAKSFQNQS
jgi:general transcription factor 3C polypeptide 5 (transcription factor C subunit 1)